MNVLSLFDGKSCGQLALQRAGIPVCKYYASEIDKPAITIAMKNFPNTIQLGDVTKLESWYATRTPYNSEPIDLLMGGSPCQGLSFAGGQLAFDDPRSKLFFEFVKVKDAVKPKYFLLENVKMKQEFQDVITDYMGVEPIEINSSLFSAQSRRRLYWTNIPVDMNIKDKGLVLKDILQEDHGEPPVPINERNARHHKHPYQKALCTTATMYKGAGNNGMTIVDRLIPVGMAEEYAHYNYRATKEVYHMNGKAPTLLTMQGGNREPKVATYSTDGGKIVDLEGMTWRKLTPIECERLQTLPDNYTEGVSKTQRYKMIGNGWTVDVIAHILKGMEIEKKYKLNDPIWDERWTRC